MKKWTVCIQLILSLLFNLGLVMGQKQYVLPQIAPKSPNVAGFEKYGDIPVSMNTGVANVTIPLTSITIDGLSIPITLSYHNTGLKVEEIASWVGYGWDLQAGGMISWSVHGLNDFDPQTNGLYAGGYQALRDYYRGAMNQEQQYWFFENILNEQQDSEFDRFSLKLLNHTNLFYFDTLQKVRLIPQSDLKVGLHGNGFKVMDLIGNQFFFESSEHGYMEDASAVTIRPSSESTSFYLSKVITKNGRVIRFTYQSYWLQYNKTNLVKRFGRYNSQIPTCPINGQESSSTYIYQEYLLPDSIVYDEGYVKFTKTINNRLDLATFNTSGIPSLSEIKIVNNNGKPVNQFSFIQGYFGDKTKLKLAAIQEQVGTTTGRRWDFKYYGENSAFPDFYSNSKDHWGFFNGRPNSGLIPRADYGYILGTPSQGSADRTSDFRSSILSMLHSIKYPTGGTTVFEYEPNQFRVKKPSDALLTPFMLWPDDAFPVIRTPITSGDSHTQPYGNFTLTAPTLCEFRFYRQLDPGQVDDARIIFSGTQSGVDVLNTAMNIVCSGGACMDQKVIILPAGNYSFTCQLGHNTYNEMETLNSNFDLIKKHVDSTNVPPYEVGGGRIKKVISSDSAGGPDMIKKYIYDDSLTHVEFRNIPYYLTSLLVRAESPSSMFCEDCGMQYTITGDNVASVGGSNIEYRNVTELYDSTGQNGKIEYTFMTSVNEGDHYGVQPHVPTFNKSWLAGNLLKKKVYKFQDNQFSLIALDSNSYYNSAVSGVMRGIKVDYSSYCRISSPGGASPPTRTHRTNLPVLYTQQFYQNQSIKKEYSNNTIARTANSLAQSPNHLQTTKIENFDSRQQSIVEKIIYPLDYTNRHLATTGEALAIRKLADTNVFAPVEIIQIKKIGGVEYVVGGTINTYRTDKTLLAKTYSLKNTAPVLLSSFVQSYINASGAFIKDANYEERIVFNKYDLFGNIIELQKKNDQPVSYIYDYKKMYPIAEVLNADSISIAYTSFESDGTGNWNIGSAQRITGNSVTGNNHYQLSSGAISKSNLITNKTYIVSYWTKNVSPFNIASTVGTPIQAGTSGDWRCFIHRVLGVTQITISGSGFIDELRLYPQLAQMTTWTYEPMIGITTQCNSNNQLVYYEYDTLNRLMLVRDEDKNILKKAEYKYRQKP